MAICAAACCRMSVVTCFNTNKLGQSHFFCHCIWIQSFELDIGIARLSKTHGHMSWPMLKQSFHRTQFCYAPLPPVNLVV